MQHTNCALISAIGVLSAVALSCAARTYFDGGHPVPTCFQDDTYTACCHPLSQPTDNASSDQNILHGKLFNQAPFVISLRWVWLIMRFLLGRLRGSHPSNLSSMASVAYSTGVCLEAITSCVLRCDV